MENPMENFLQLMKEIGLKVWVEDTKEFDFPELELNLRLSEYPGATPSKLLDISPIRKNQHLNYSLGNIFNREDNQTIRAINFCYNTKNLPATTITVDNSRGFRLYHQKQDWEEGTYETYRQGWNTSPINTIKKDGFEKLLES